MALLTARVCAAPCDPAATWEGMVEAKGGRKALEELRTVYLHHRDKTLLYALGKRVSEFHAFFRFPDFLWTWIDTGTTMFGVQVGVTDLPSGLNQYTSEAMSPVRTRTISTAARYDELLVTLFEVGGIRPQPVACRPLLGGGIAVETRLGPAQFTYFLREGESLPYAVESEERGQSHVKYRILEYRTIGGLRLPTKLEVAAGGRPRVLVAKYELNPEYDPEILVRDPSYAAGPDAWRPKHRKK